MLRRSLAWYCTTTTAAASIKRVTHVDKSPEAQKELLRREIRLHEEKVQRNALYPRERQGDTYADDACVVFPHYNLATLPSTQGKHRQHIRSALLPSSTSTSSSSGSGCSDAMQGVRDLVLLPWQEGSRCSHQVVVFGCNSVSYLQRQLRLDADHSILVVDHSLKSLANAAAVLVGEHKERVHFLRSDAMFACTAVIPAASADVVVAPMPAPFWSEAGSHRRLVTCEFLCAAHRILQARTSASDPRGFVTFTDAEPYADFMLEQLEESKLIVPWTRKNPHEAYARWLPLATATATETTTTSAPSLREFPKQRFEEVVCIAASKSGDTTAQALNMIEAYDYTRRYYRSFNK